MIISSSVYKELISSSEKNTKLLTVLIDPEKFPEENAKQFFKNLSHTVTHIFVGGSTAENEDTRKTVNLIRNFTSLPVILFPGDHSQITEEADAILFLSLISGRNPEYLIEQQVRAVEKLKDTKLEIIPTGYILIDGGSQCAVERVSQTRPMPQNDIEKIINTALAGEFSGKKLIYLEAGSGAKVPVSPEIIRAVKRSLSIPLVVGGGIKTSQQLTTAYNAGADMVVIGTAYEEGIVI